MNEKVKFEKLTRIVRTDSYKIAIGMMLTGLWIWATGNPIFQLNRVKEKAISIFYLWFIRN